MITFQFFCVPAPFLIFVDVPVYVLYWQLNLNTIQYSFKCKIEDSSHLLRVWTAL